MRRLLLLAMAGIAAVPSAQRARSAAAVELTRFTYRTIEFVAPSIEGAWAECGVYLPLEYDAAANAERRWPLAIWLHGLNEDHRRFHSGGADVLDDLRAAGKIPPLIFVAAQAPRRTLYLNGERDGDIEDLILHDLIGHLETSYRVSGERGQRAIMGVSMGGAGAMRIALVHPQRFGAVAVHSSALLPADPDALPERFQRFAGPMLQSLGLDELFGDPIDKAKWAKAMPAGILQSIDADHLAGLRIYFDVGTDDRYGFAPLNEQFHQALERKKIAHTFRLIEGGGHSWGSGSLQKTLEESLQFVGACFAGKPAGGEKTDK
jgi:S-formylglutathione hydrolase FrmB